MTGFADSELLFEALRRARAGERRAYADIYRLLERPVRTLARRLVSRAAVAEDLAQDVFVEVLTSLGQYDGRGSFAGWVRSITVRKCLMHLRSPWRRGRQWIESLDGEQSFEPGESRAPSSGGAPSSRSPACPRSSAQRASSAIGVFTCSSASGKPNSSA
jgi:RNA polymerase sigma factor (sigma-70 family)